MKATKKSTKTEETRHLKRIKKGLSKAPWVLRITEHRDKPAPVMIVKERIPAEQRDDTGDLVAPRSVLRERGLVYGPPQVRCLPRIRTILTRICDKAGIPFELHRHLQGKRITFRGNLPLDEEAGCKLALICKLQERIKEMDRVELLGPPGGPVLSGGSRLLAFPDHQLWGRGQPMGIGGYEGNAGGSASGSECRAYAGGSEAEILRLFSL